MEGASTFNQNLCPWAVRINDQQLPKVEFSKLFLDTACPDPSTPLQEETTHLVMGSFCHRCDGSEDDPSRDPPSPSEPAEDEPVSSKMVAAEDDFLWMAVGACLAAAGATVIVCRRRRRKRRQQVEMYSQVQPYDDVELTSTSGVVS
jgi:hypothetical protein